MSLFTPQDICTNRCAAIVKTYHMLADTILVELKSFTDNSLEQFWVQHVFSVFIITYNINVQVTIKVWWGKMLNALFGAILYRFPNVFFY